MRKSLIFLLLLLSSCSQYYVRTHNSHFEMWQARLTQLIAEFEASYEADKKWAEFTFQQTKVMPISQAQSQKISTEFASRVINTYKTGGRGQILGEWIKFIEQKPSGAMAQSWFDTKLATIQKDFADLTGKVKNYNNSIQQAASQDWLTTFEVLARANGTLLGQYDELALIYKQAQNYYTDIQNAQIADYNTSQRFSESLQTLGIAIIQSNPYVPR